MPIYRKEENLLQEAYKLILEKNHIKSMIKLGYPERVAEYMQDAYKKYSLYFADFLADNDHSVMNFLWNINQTPLTDDELAQQTRMLKSYIYVTYSEDFTTIIDWVREVPNINLKRYTYEDALRQANDYYLDKKHNAIAKEKNKILKDYGNGWYWVDLESKSDEEEGEAAGHCGSTEDGDTIWSLRNKNHQNVIKTWVSVAISPSENTWHQAKGPRNSKPKKELWPMIVDVFIENDITNFKAEYSSGADFNGTDLINMTKDTNPEFAERIYIQYTASDIVYDIVGIPEADRQHNPKAIVTGKEGSAFTIWADNEDGNSWLHAEPMNKSHEYVICNIKDNIHAELWQEVKEMQNYYTPRHQLTAGYDRRDARQALRVLDLVKKGTPGQKKLNEKLALILRPYIEPDNIYNFIIDSTFGVIPRNEIGESGDAVVFWWGVYRDGAIPYKTKEHTENYKRLATNFIRGLREKGHEINKLILDTLDDISK